MQIIEIRENLDFMNIENAKVRVTSITTVAKKY